MAFVAKLGNRIFRNTGACLSPVNAYLNLIGIETLGLRMERECQNALELAHWIAENYSDIIVNYPGLESSSWHHVVKEQFEHGYGAILTLRVGSKEKAFKFIDSLTIPVYHFRHRRYKDAQKSETNQEQGTGGEGKWQKRLIMLL